MGLSNSEDFESVAGISADLETLGSATETLLDFDYVHDTYGLEVALSRVSEKEGEIPVETERGFTEKEKESLEIVKVYRGGPFSQVKVPHIPEVVREYQESKDYHDAVSELLDSSIRETIIPDGTHYLLKAEVRESLDSGIFNFRHQTVEKAFSIDDETINWGCSEGRVERDAVEELNQAAQELPNDLVIPEHTGQQPVEQIDEELDEEYRQLLSDNSIWGLDVATLQSVTQQILDDPAYQQAVENRDEFQNQYITITYTDVTPDYIQEDDGFLQRKAKKLGQALYDGQRTESQIDVEFTEQISPQIVRRSELKR